MIKKTILLILILGLILINGCNSQPKTQEEAEKVAERFARFWEQENYSSMYDLFIPELKELRNKEDFVKFAEIYNKKPEVMRLDKVSMDSEDISYAYYSVSGYEIKIPAIKLEYVDQGWKINVKGLILYNYLIDECAEKCSESDCEKLTCSKETEFKCHYELIDPCSCKDKWDCSYDKPNCINGYCSTGCMQDSDCSSDKPLCVDGTCQPKQCEYDTDCKDSIPADVKYDCESKGLKYYVHYWCPYWYEGGVECKFSCYEYELEAKMYENNKETDKLKVKVIPGGNTYFEINNYGPELTKVIIRINNEYSKTFDKIEFNARLKIDRSEFLRISTYSPEMGEGVQVEDIYLYSEQGKWWN